MFFVNPIMKFLVVGLLLSTASIVAAQSSIALEQQEEYLIDIENFDGEGDVFDYIFPEFDSSEGKG